MEKSLIQNINSLKNLPTNWAVFPFTEVIDDVSGGNLKTQKSEFLEKGLLPIIDQGKELVAGYVDNKKAIVKTKIPHIVFGDHTRILKYIDFPFAMGADGTKILKVKSNIEAIEKYIYYFFQTLNIPETGYNRHFKYLKECLIPLPTLATQQRIAAILDQADAIIQNNRAIVQKYDALTQSLFLDMFGDPVKNEKGYKIVKLIDVSTKITDGVHAKPEYTESGVPFISVKDITTGSLTFENCKFISNEAHQKYYKRCNPEYDDILYTKVGATYGRPAIVDVKDEFSLYVSVALIKPNRELINPKYLKDALGNPAIKRQADKAIKGIGVPDLHLNMIKEFLLPLPTLEEQNEFESRVIAIEAQKQQAQLELAKSEELFQSLLQRAFNGELS